MIGYEQAPFAPKSEEVHPPFDRESYWEDRLDNLEMSVEYAKRILGAIAIEYSKDPDIIQDTLF